MVFVDGVTMRRHGSEKLRILYDRQLRRCGEGKVEVREGGGAGLGVKDGEEEQGFLQCVLSLLLRYDALGGHGYQVRRCYVGT